MIIPYELVKKTEERFPEFYQSAWTPIHQGGSDRQFYRFKNELGASLILIHYNQEKAENSSYASHAFFLKEQGIAVPQVMGYSSQECLLWLQDLGEKSLWSLRNESWEKRRYWYERVLIETARFHRISLEKVEAAVALQPRFDHHLYSFEQNYFFEYALESLFKIDSKKIEQLAALPSLHLLARELSLLPQQLIHRDLQSQNILLFEQRTWLIDFQGMRAGLAPYDLASLLCDPYVTLSSIEQKTLLDFYQKEMHQHHFFFAYDVEKVFWQCAVQRLMQALGAYGFLGLHRGKSHFLAHVPSALNRLCHALAQLDSEHALEELTDVLESLKTDQHSKKIL